MGSTQLFGFDPSLFPHPWLDGQVNSSQVRVEVVEQWQYWHGESVAIINQFVEPCVEKPLDCNNSVESCIYKHGMYPGATQDKLRQLVTGGLLVERSTPAKKDMKVGPNHHPLFGMDTTDEITNHPGIPSLEESAVFTHILTPWLCPKKSTGFEIFYISWSGHQPFHILHAIT